MLRKQNLDLFLLMAGSNNLFQGYLVIQFAILVCEKDYGQFIFTFLFRALIWNIDLYYFQCSIETETGDFENYGTFSFIFKIVFIILISVSKLNVKYYGRIII